MECSLAHRAASSTASKQLMVSFGFLACCLEADEAAAMMFGEDLIEIILQQQDGYGAVRETGFVC